MASLSRQSQICPQNLWVKNLSKCSSSLHPHPHGKGSLCMLRVGICRFPSLFHATEWPHPAWVGTRRELP